MSKIMRFTPKRELSAQQNLSNFVALARDHLTLWSDLEGFAWEAEKWPTTYKSIRFTNFEHSELHASKHPELHQLMHPAFAVVAKAYLRYRHTLRARKEANREMQALRVIEFALRRDMAIPDITRFGQWHWDIAVSALEPVASRQNVCSVMRSILKTLADFLILTVDPGLWGNPYVGRRSYDASNGTRAPDEVKAKKLPDQDALLGKV